MELTISIGRNAFVFFCPYFVDKEDKYIETVRLGDGGEILVFFDERASHIKETLAPFSPSQVMYGLSSYSPEGLLPMKIELGMWRFEIVGTLTIIADSVSAEIS